MGARRALAGLLLAGCVGTAPQAPRQPQVSRGVPPALPDSVGWGVHVLALERAPDGAMWAGTYGEGVFVFRRDTSAWEQIVPRRGDPGALSWAWVNSIAFARDGSIWYGTVGNGFGRSTDGGRTWRNWTREELGAEWQYVAADGIATQGDTVLIATADGLRLTWDGGESWRCVRSSPAAGSAAPRDACTERLGGLPTDYLLSIDVERNGTIWLGHLQGVSTSRDGGRTWRHLDVSDGGVPRERVRAIAVDVDSMSESLWAATESDIYVDSAVAGKFRKATITLPGWPGLPGAPRAIVPSPGYLLPTLALSFGMAVGDDGGGYRIYYLAAGERYRPAADMWTMVWWGAPGLWPVGASSAGLSRVLAGNAPPVPVQLIRPVAAEAARHTWFGRPIAANANPYIDATYRYGSTMAGSFQEHMGVRFNNPEGTPVLAIGEGTVVFAGQAGGGSNTIAILHDRRWEDRFVFSTYYHASALEVSVGQRVRAGDTIARVGHTGRATSNHLTLEVHIAPTEDVAAIVNAEERFPPFTVNPELWVEPVPGTGIVAGRVVDASGNPVRGARIYGLVQAYPEETPFSYAETYGDRGHPDPAYGEHFAVGGVAPGDYLIGVDIGERRVWRRARVEAGRVTFVEFSP